MKELVAKIKLPQYKITTCMNALVHSKDAIKSSEKVKKKKNLRELDEIVNQHFCLSGCI